MKMSFSGSRIHTVVANKLKINMLFAVLALFDLLSKILSIRFNWLVGVVF